MTDNKTQAFHVRGNAARKLIALGAKNVGSYYGTTLPLVRITPIAATFPMFINRVDFYKATDEVKALGHATQAFAINSTNEGREGGKECDSSDGLSIVWYGSTRPWSSKGYR